MIDVKDEKNVRESKAMPSYMATLHTTCAEETPEKKKKDLENQNGLCTFPLSFPPLSRCASFSSHCPLFGHPWTHSTTTTTTAYPAEDTAALLDFDGELRTNASGCCVSPTTRLLSGGKQDNQHTLGPIAAP
jgi:hypothetical protein